ncbi:MAG: hypothetical protein ACI80K_002527 [Paracoccaceae bacterium]|jgi:hypothetical protein
MATRLAEGNRSVKGLAVLALGAILIWFGLSRSGGAPEDVVHAGTGPDALASQAGRSLEERLTLGESKEARRSGLKPEENSSDARREGRAAAAVPAARPVETVPVPAQPESRVEPASIQQEPERIELMRPVEAPPQSSSLELLEDPGPTAEHVATFLLESWLANSSADLQVFLQQGQGAEMPEARRQLVASFWHAVSGDPDKAREGLDRIRGAKGITTAQESLLGAALAVPGSRAVPRSASTGRVDPLSLAMRMMLLGDEAAHLLSKREYGRSAVAWSDLIQAEVNAPWAPHQRALLDWGTQLDKAQSNHRFNVNGTWPSIEEKIQRGGSLIRLRKRVLKRRSDLVICTGLISQVNGVRGYVHPGDVMRVPTDRVNVIVDLGARILMYRHGDEVVKLWDVGIGKAGHETPEGVFTVGHKISKPAHTTKGLPYGDPENELGSRWMGLRQPGLDRDTSYGIHGTSFPNGVGGAVSLGCVRMRNEDVDELFEILPQGSQVVIQL